MELRLAGEGKMRLVTWLRRDGDQGCQRGLGPEPTAAGLCRCAAGWQGRAALIDLGRNGDRTGRG